MSTFVPLRYSLPQTIVRLNAHVRYVVVVDELGGHLAPQVAVSWSSLVVPDRQARCSATLNPLAMEKVSLAVELSSEGLITSIGTTVGGATLPSFFASSGRHLASTAALPMPTEPGRLDETDATTWVRSGALRRVFDHTHTRTAALIADLSSRAEQFLAGLRMSDQPTEVLNFGSALEVVERELAAADRMRREWIASQGFDVRSDRWDLDLASLVSVYGGSSDAAPSALPGDTVIPGALKDLADHYGVLVAVVDPQRTAPTTAAPVYDRHDELLIRRARPVTVAVYRRAPAGVVGHDEDAPWTLDEKLTSRLDAVDAGSVLDVLSPDGQIFGERSVHLAFHPDGSVRTFGLTTVEAGMQMPAVYGGQGGGEDAAPGLAEVAAAALESARLQLDLLHVSDEFTKLAATHAHRGELATLEQDARFASLRHVRR